MNEHATIWEPAEGIDMPCAEISFQYHPSDNQDGYLSSPYPGIARHARFLDGLFTGRACCVGRRHGG